MAVRKEIVSRAVSVLGWVGRSLIVALLAYITAGMVGGSIPANAGFVQDPGGTIRRMRAMLDGLATFAPAAARVAVRELSRVLVPRHLQQPLLHAVVEPRATEDELA